MSQLKGFREEPDATLPVSDAERWIAGTYAIWSEYCGGSCKYLGGYEKTKSNAKMIAKVLQEDWLVSDHDSGVDMVKYLLEDAGPSDDDEEYDEDDDGFDDDEYDEYGEDFDDDECDEEDEDFDDNEYDEEDEEYAEGDEGYDKEDEEHAEDDEGYDEEDEEYAEDDEKYDEEDEFDDDDEEYDENDEEYDDDEEYDEDDEEFDDDYEVDTTAFDYACACNMCGRMFIAGYLTREEAISYATEAAKKIQELYNSWEEYFQAYIIGAAGGSNVKDIMPFAAAYQKVLSSPNNSFGLDWNTPL